MGFLEEPAADHGGPRMHLSVASSVPGTADARTVVRVRGGNPKEQSEVEVAATVSRARLRRKRKERRGKRWLRGKMLLNFGILGSTRKQMPRQGEMKLSAVSGFGREQKRDRNRGRIRPQELRKEQVTITGIPFNYYHTLSKIYNRMASTKQRPFDDLKVRALAVRDNGNTLPLCVTGISTALADMGHSQRDFLVAAKAVINGDQVVVEPTNAEEKKINLVRLQPGEGLLMVEYYAHTNRIAHVFAKGSVPLDIYKKALAQCLAVCENAAASTLALLQKKYEKSMEPTARTEKMAPTEKPLRSQPRPESVALKASFGQLLSGIRSTATRVADDTEKMDTNTPASETTLLKSAVSQQPPSAKPSSVAVKKPTLAELAKRKKT